MSAHLSRLDRVTVDPHVRFGKPAIRGSRITVQDILGWLASGMSHEEILADYTFLEPDDILAALEFAAADAGDRTAVVYGE